MYLSVFFRLIGIFLCRINVLKCGILMRVAKERNGEENVSTQKYCPKASTWIQSENEHESWPFDTEATARKRTKTSDCIG